MTDLKTLTTALEDHALEANDFDVVVAEDIAAVVLGSDWLAERDARIRVESGPPTGWFAAGSFARYPWIDLELSDDVDDGGAPLWERPATPRMQYGFIRPTISPDTVDLLGTEDDYRKARHKNDTSPTKALRLWVRRYVPRPSPWELADPSQASPGTPR